MKSDDKMSKLRTYKLIKKTFGIETYLELNERKYRKALCALRISSHKLNIERGRYLTIKSKVEDRLCNICDVVEDEVHALCKCKKFDTFRQQMYLIIKKKLNICKPET